MNVISRIENSDDRCPYVLNHVIPNITSAPSTGERKSVPGIENVIVEDERWGRILGIGYTGHSVPLLKMVGRIGYQGSGVKRPLVGRCYAYSHGRSGLSPACW